jgi:hypothetical protein
VLENALDRLALVNHSDDLTPAAALTPVCETFDTAEPLAVIRRARELTDAVLPQSLIEPLGKAMDLSESRAQAIVTNQSGVLTPANPKA